MNLENMNCASAYNISGLCSARLILIRSGESMAKKILPFILLCAVFATMAAAQTRPLQQPEIGNVSARRADARQETFDIVWRTVKEKHFDPAFGGVDWDKVREQYAPRVARLKSDAELYSLLQKMIGELHQSHFYIIPPEAIPGSDLKEPEAGGVGLDLQIIDGQAVITRVEPDSKAASAALRPGYIIKQIDGASVEQMMRAFASSKESPAMIRLRMRHQAIERVNGKPGSFVRIGYLDGQDKLREAAIERERLKGEMSPAFGNFPPQYMEFESRRLQGGIGYIRFNIFVAPLAEKLRAAIRSMSDAPGLIIDLRGNPGGIGGMASGLAGLLETKEASLGTMTMRAAKIHFAVFPQSGAYKGKVVILTDSGSASTSEVFAAGMQELGRAAVVGERSMGAALPSQIQKLPTGALFQYAVADFKTPKGMLIEGRGVAPDREVKLTRAALLAGRDSQLDAAIEQITKNQ
jgi:carboxyl-terminal processing protease